MFPVRQWAVDSGYLAPKVYEWASRFSADRVCVVKGEEKGQTFGRRGSDVEMTVGTMKRKIGHALWLANKPMLIDQFYSWLSQDAPTREKLAEGEGYPTGYVHTPQMPEEFFRQLTADVKINGKYEDKVNYHRNEALDIKTYCDLLTWRFRLQFQHAREIPLPTVTVEAAKAVAVTRPKPKPRSAFWNREY